MVLSHQVHGQCRRVKLDATEYTAISEQFQQSGSMPQMAIISVNQHIDHHVNMSIGRHVSVGQPQVSFTEAPRNQEILLTGQENHGQLSDHIANMGATHIIGGRVA